MKIHIVGTAGSGKTTLAGWASREFRMRAHDLDWIVYGEDGERPPSEIVSRVDEILRQPGWATEGAYRDAWLYPLLREADCIVWLDVPLPVCVLRMVKRHLLAELHRDNPHPGWRRLFRFIRYSLRTDGSQRAETRRLLARYGAKVSRCRSSRDLRRVKAKLCRAR